MELTKDKILSLTPVRNYKKVCEELFAECNVKINGAAASDIIVHDERIFAAIIRNGTLGLGESYMQGWWDCDDIPEMMAKFSKAKISQKFRKNPYFIFNRIRALVLNEGDTENAAFGVRTHYDIGNDLYRSMLDSRLTYTCGYWNNARTLEEAQRDKLELICRKLELRPGMKVLDIGCGWGSFMKYAAENYGVSCVGVSNSVEQVKYGKELCQNLPIEFRLQDYREAEGQFDRVLSVGMFEHVCYKNHRTYMEVVHRCLKDDGLSLLHTMGRTKSMVRGNDQWITKYIFPNTQVPSVAQVGESIDGLFVMEDWENLSTDYEKTLLAWYRNFDENWDALRDSYGDQFYRMWKYYLLICAGWYRSRVLQLWQVVLTKDGVPGGYQWQKSRKGLV